VGSLAKQHKACVAKAIKESSERLCLIGRGEGFGMTLQRVNQSDGNLATDPIVQALINHHNLSAFRYRAA
jgi:hypothetical protein